MATKIEVEWIAQSQSMTQALERMNAKLDAQDKKLEKIGKTSAQAATAAAGSFGALQKKLTDAEKALRGMAAGTEEFKRQRAEVEKLRAAVGNAAGAMNAQTAGVGARITASIGSMLAGMVGVQTVVNAVSEEFAKIHRINVESAATTRTLEQALADLAQNIPANELNNARKMITEQAPKLGTTQEGLANLLGVGISAGAKDLEEALKLSSAALRITAGDAQKALPLVGSTLDVASLGRSTNFEGAAGQLLQVQSQVRSTNLPEFGRNIGPGLAAATIDKEQMKGVSTEVALETAAVISQVIKDPTGSNTATAMRQFFGRLGTFTPEQNQKIDGRNVRVDRDTIRKFSAENTFEGRIGMMRENENLAAQFLDTQRESIGKVAIGAIVKGDDQLTLNMERKAQAAIGNLDDAQVEFRARAAAIEDNTKVLSADRKSAASLEAYQTDGSAGFRGEASVILERAMSNVDLSGFDWVRSGEAAANMKLAKSQGVSEPQAAIEVLQTLSKQNNLFGIPFGGEPSAEMKQYFQEQIALLRSIDAEMKAQKTRPAGQPGRQVRPQSAPLPSTTVP